MLREIKPYPVVAINPELAVEKGIVDGEWVCIENPWGKCYEKAKVTPIVKKNVIMADHGWWFPEEDMDEPNLGGVWKANINLLVPNNEIGFYGFGALYKSLPCKINKADHAPLVEHRPQDLPDLQNFPGSIRNDPDLKSVVRMEA
jgi:anaerobic selenocysteine-containing dehydrogenase